MHVLHIVILAHAQKLSILLYNYYITWRAIIYREIFRSRSTISARPKGGRIPRSRTEYFPILPDRNKFII